MIIQRKCQKVVGQRHRGQHDVAVVTWVFTVANPFFVSGLFYTKETSRLVSRTSLFLLILLYGHWKANVSHWHVVCTCTPVLTHTHWEARRAAVLLVISSWYTNTKGLYVWRQPPSLSPFIPQAKFLSSNDPQNPPLPPSLLASS